MTVTDNGIGMTREDLTQALGTIARSGTRAFLERLRQQSKDEKDVGADLIGQFGIGFYSAFMVADHIDVFSRRAGTDAANRWSSDGKGSFSTAAVALDEAPAPGTKVVLHLNDASDDYLEPSRIDRFCANIRAPSRFPSI